MEGNDRNKLTESGSDNIVDTENSSHNLTQYMEATFTIEYIDPSLDATDEILQRFDAESDAEFDPVVAV